MEYEKWGEVLAPYEHAVEELKVKFKNIRKEFLTKGEYSPIEFVTGRTKKIASIISKAKRLSITNIEEEMEDIAGIRIMCQFVEDIYTLVELIKNRSDMNVVYEKDYIENFKDSGYRSYHVIIKYPINSIAGSKEILCEIQIRTLAMNFWATIEHSLKYKYEHYIPENVAVRLRRAADAAFLLDQEMSEIREDIMKAQVMYQVKSITLRDVLSKIQELYEVGDTHRALIFQRRLDKIDNEKDISEIIQLKKEIDELLQKYK
jgi:putative GTP pyrophosphokinase